MRRLLTFLKTLDAHDKVGIFSAGIVVSLVVAMLFGALQESGAAAYERMAKDGGKTQYAQREKNVRYH